MESTERLWFRGGDETPDLGAAILAVAVIAAPGARAFTFDNQGGNNSDGTPRFTDPDEGIDRFVDPSASPSARSRRDLIDPWRNPDRLTPIPNGAQIGAGEYGFGNNSRYGYDGIGRPR